MTIFHLTDQHIAPDGIPTHGIDVRANFLEGISLALDWQPDALVLSGDLCFEVGDESVYRWMKPHLDNLPFPWFVIPGNHDDSNLMTQVFDSQRLAHFSEGCFTARIADRPVIFLNSETGFLTKNQLAWFEARLAENPSEMSLVFIHYPPALCGMPFMDLNYPMQESSRKAFQEIVWRQPKPVYVFCGHYHAARTVALKNMLIHVTPSSYFQLDPRSEGFQIDHYRPAFRWISVKGDRVQSSIHYFRGHLAPDLPG